MEFLRKNGPSSVSTIARGNKIERTSCYQLVHSLQDRGYLYSTKQRSGNIYTAHTPEIIQSLLTPLFTTGPKSNNFQRPHIAQYIGYEQVKSMLYDRYPVRQKSIVERDGIYRGIQDAAFVKMFPEWLQWHRDRMDKSEKLHLITNVSAEEKKLSHKVARRNVKFFKHIHFSSTLWMGGEYITTIVIKGDFVYAFEQKDPILAANLTSLFDFLRASK